MSGSDTIMRVIQAIDQGGFKAAALARQLGVSRQTIYRALNQLTENGALIKKGGHYAFTEINTVKFYNNVHLAEDRMWEKDFATFFQYEFLNAENYQKISYIFMEMVNNAIDHSQSKRIIIVAKKSAAKAGLYIADDGIGIFRHIQEALGLAEKRFAILELAKGKCTTDPEKHTGEGVYFSSRVANRFAIESDELTFLAPNTKHEDFLANNDPIDEGTRVYTEVSTYDKRKLAEIFAQHEDEVTHGFTKTTILVKLLAFDEGNMNFASRSQARRLLNRVDRFKEVVFDFAGVESIQRAFADEIFRVFQNQNPECKLSYRNANQQVELMILRAALH